MNEMEDGLRILARIIARAHMEREKTRRKEAAANNLDSKTPATELESQASLT